MAPQQMPPCQRGAGGWGGALLGRRPMCVVLRATLL